MAIGDPPRPGVRDYYDANTWKFLLAGTPAGDPPRAVGPRRHEPRRGRPPRPRTRARRARPGRPARAGPRLRSGHGRAVPRAAPAGRGRRRLDQPRRRSGWRSGTPPAPAAAGRRALRAGRLHGAAAGPDRLRPGLRHRGVRARRPGRGVLREAARALRPGGALVIVDDVLRRRPRRPGARGLPGRLARPERALGRRGEALAAGAGLAWSPPSTCRPFSASVVRGTG